MKSIALLICAVTAAAAFSFTGIDHEEWKAFKLEHQKQYDTEQEDEQRMKIYAENKRRIVKHNQLFARGLVTYSLKLNKYSDLTHHEFVSTMQGYNGTEDNAAASGIFVPRHKEHSYSLPVEVDWRNVGAVTPIKDQGQCGSCWAFSTTGALEGQYFLKTGLLVSLSEQNLIDCSWAYGNLGCSGGLMTRAFNYIRNNGGIDTGLSYPYEERVGMCRYNPFYVGAHVAGYYNIRKDEQVLMYAVATVGPIAVTLYAGLDSFRHYEKGVYDDERCIAYLPPTHAILIVGYGTDEGGRDYWLIKNSWGTTWGMDGYARIARNRGNRCGIASNAVFPIVF